jgi:hypothetical protein
MRTPAPLELRKRILAPFPAGHYALEGLLRLLDVVLDDEIETAAVECGATPRLLLAPLFLEERCKTEEHLLMLVLHEIHHVLLGHTRLFPRITPVQNLAFDAVINALLCHMLPDAPYRSFFEELYRADRFPDCLLRPPPGWPHDVRIPESLPPRVREVVRSIYGRSGVGYGELFALIEKTISELALELGAVLLLGDHGPDQPVDDALLGAIRSIVEKWPQPPDPIIGRSVGGELRELLLGTERVPAAVRAIRRIFRGLALDRPGGAEERRQFLPAPSAAEVVLPDLRDRRALVRRLLGETPLLYRAELPKIRPDPRPAIVHVYVDVSGSTDRYYGHLVAAVRPHVERGRCVVHAFSTRVTEVTPADLRAGRLESTGGTDIACVTGHMREHGVSRALLVTDGYVGPVPDEDRRWLEGRKARIAVALTPDGFRDDLGAVTWRFIELPLEDDFRGRD